MFYLLLALLLLALGLVSTTSGVVVIYFGIPIRETTFGSALLMVGSVAIAGGFVTVGLAAAIAELRLVIQALKARMPAVPRPLKPGERKDGEKQPGPAPPRNRLPPRLAAAAPPPTPPTPPTPPGSPMPPMAAHREPSTARPEGGRVLTPQDSARGARPEWLRRAFAELPTAPEPPQPPAPPPVGPPEPPAPHRNDLRTRDGWPHLSKPPPSANFPPVPDVAAEPRWPQTPAQPKIFDMTWPSARGRPAGEGTPPEMAPPEPSMRQPEPRPAPPMTPSPAAGRPPAPASPPRPDPRPPSILKSGVIDEMAYTLFTDGSIEAQLPEGTTRFASIEELREHLEKREG